MNRIHIGIPGAEYTLVHSKEDGNSILIFMDAETSGISNEQLLEVLINRMSVLYGKLPDDYTLEAIRHCTSALHHLDLRTEARREKGILGVQGLEMAVESMPGKEVLEELRKRDKDQEAEMQKFIEDQLQKDEKLKTERKHAEFSAKEAISKLGNMKEGQKVSFKIGAAIHEGVILGKGNEEETWIVKSRDVQYAISTNKLTKV